MAALCQRVSWTPRALISTSAEKWFRTVPVIKKISKSVTKRILSELKKKLKKDEAGYDTFWEQFGKVLKEGLYEDYEYRDKIAEITRAYSLKHQKLISLDAYLEEMADKQDKIYYLTADTLKQAKTSPHLEGFRSQRYRCVADDGSHRCILDVTDGRLQRKVILIHLS